MSYPLDPRITTKRIIPLDAYTCAVSVGYNNGTATGCEKTPDLNYSLDPILGFCDVDHDGAEPYSIATANVSDCSLERDRKLRSMQELDQRKIKWRQERDEKRKKWFEEHKRPPTPFPTLPAGEDRSLPPVEKSQCSEAGPGYWCTSDENFKQCVQNYGYTGTRETFSACQKKKEVDKCASGPSYWCATESNFKECNPDSKESKDESCAKQKQMEDPCRAGPQYWCSSDDAFQQCLRSPGVSRLSFPACINRQ